MLEQANGTGSTIEGVTFPVVDYRSRQLRQVVFSDCDVGQLGFAGPFLRDIEVMECSFVDCTGPHHVRYRGVAFSRCAWVGGRLSGAITKSSMVDCRWSGVEIDELRLANDAIDRLDALALTGTGLTIQDSRLRRVHFEGRLRNVNLTDLTLQEVDLTRFRVTDGGMLGLRGDFRLPDFADSFVVSREQIRTLKPFLLSLVRPEVHQTLELLIDDGVELEWFDARRLDSTPRDLPRLWPEEQDRVMRRLWESRIRKQPA